jgi:hypothetical protein
LDVLETDSLDIVQCFLKGQKGLKIKGAEIIAVSGLVKVKRYVFSGVDDAFPFSVY